MEEKINRLRKLVKVIDSYNDLLFMCNKDKIILRILEDKVLEILRTL